MDAWLLERFPNRTLEELDSMDFARYWKALAVQRVQVAERVRDLQLEGKYDPMPAEWVTILRNDRLMDEAAE